MNRISEPRICDPSLNILDLLPRDIEFDLRAEKKWMGNLRAYLWLYPGPHGKDWVLGICWGLGSAVLGSGPAVPGRVSIQV